MHAYALAYPAYFAAWRLLLVGSIVVVGIHVAAEDKKPEKFTIRFHFTFTTSIPSFTYCLQFRQLICIW